MGTRFAIFGLTLAGIVGDAFVHLQSGQSTVLEIFFWLGLILVTCAVALWPFAGRDQRVELELERTSWADRIDFREPAAVLRTAASFRRIPAESRASRGLSAPAR